MAGENKIIYLYDDFTEDMPVLLGKLYVGAIKGGETYSFEYDVDWLIKNKLGFMFLTIPLLMFAFDIKMSEKVRQIASGLMVGPVFMVSGSIYMLILGKDDYYKTIANKSRKCKSENEENLNGK